MADGRAVRASTRRTTPQPPPTAQAGRAPRRRGTRSASRQIEAATPPKGTRRSARQASVASIAHDAEHEVRPLRRTKSYASQEAVRDLTTVEEADSQTSLENAPQSTPRPKNDLLVTHDSPGANSEMSGTTAFSSFSMAESESLDSRVMQRDLSKLYESSTDFLNHLVPDEAQVRDDCLHIQEMQKPDSDFNKDYRYHDEDFTHHLSRFRGELQQYIRLRAVHRALLGPDRDYTEPQPGLDLVLYLANLLIFAKQMIGSDRAEHATWNTLRELDRTFPEHFLPAIAIGVSASPIGESALYKETFDLGLELRTQLAILVLEREYNETDSPPGTTRLRVGADSGTKDTLNSVFYQPVHGAEESRVLRSWKTNGLAGIGGGLSNEQRNFIEERIEEMSEGLHNIHGLGEDFSWMPLVLQILDWVRRRHREIQEAVKRLGGITAIMEMVKANLQGPAVSFTENGSTLVGETSIQGHAERKRFSRKSIPHEATRAPVWARFLAKEKRILAAKESAHMHQQEEEPTRLVGHRIQPPIEPTCPAKEPTRPVKENTRPLKQPTQQERQPKQPEQPVTELVQPVEEGEVNRLGYQDHSEEENGMHFLDGAGDEDAQNADEEAVVGMASSSRPPQTTAEFNKIFQDAKRASENKENRNQTSFFDRQPTARAIGFGDGFDDEDQATTGPSRKGKEPVRSSPKKRSRAVTIQDSTDEDGEFETDQRSVDATARRREAPVAKKARIDPTPSAPPRQPYQASARNTGQNYLPTHQEGESEEDVPEIMEEMGSFPPQSRNRNAQRRGKNPWTPAASKALLRYQRKFPNQWVQMIEYDSRQDTPLIQDRSNVDLKDKVRNMAISQIKSGNGCEEGFEGVISKDSAKGRLLRSEGYDW